MERTEKWVCAQCILPCQLQITYDNSKLPYHLKAEDKFRKEKHNRMCPCDESFPLWEKVE